MWGKLRRKYLVEVVIEEKMGEGIEERKIQIGREGSRHSFDKVGTLFTMSWIGLDSLGTY